MLTLNPKMLPRLDELEADLVQRRDHATTNGWKGEIEGIDLTLTFLRGKRSQTHRAVSLGMPALPPERAKPSTKNTRGPESKTAQVQGKVWVRTMVASGT
jgi:hypothetical protein